MSKAGSKVIRTSRELYKYLFRQCEKLPEKIQQDHYKHHVRQGFSSHVDETDPLRIQQIIQRAVQDAEWIVTKYTKPKS